MSDEVTGTLSMTAKGFGFVRNQSGPDVFIDHDHHGTAMDGDTVRARVFRRSDATRPAGAITEVVERSGRNIVGVFRAGAANAGKLYPNDQKLPSSFMVEAEERARFPELSDGDVVVAGLKAWHDPNKKPTARLTELLGRPDQPGIDQLIVAKSKGLVTEFPEEVIRAAQALEMPATEPAARQGKSRARGGAGRRGGSDRAQSPARRDLRDLVCFTIDPASARDFDDAVSVEQLDSGLFRVGVHIADVSAFVGEDDVIDREAFRRGTSVYFVDSVIPMLPERLSADICSLRPDEDRLAFSVLLDIDSLGSVHNTEIVETVIRSHARFSYQEVEDVLSHRTSHRYGPRLHQLQLIASTLRRLREEAGSIDFDMTEPRITLDEEGIPRAVEPKERLAAHRLIEELMLLANRRVAERVMELREEWQRELPFVFRIHPKPEEAEVRDFLEAISNLGIEYRIGDSIDSEDYRNILRIFENLEHRDFVEQLALSSMTKAVYSTENVGHFGLAFPVYTHFTSPIRRYPDLLVHRLVKRYLGEAARAGAPPRRRALLGGRRGPRATRALATFLNAACDQATERELVATAAEREYTKIKSLQFLAGRVGNTYAGVVSGVTSFGLFVKLRRYLIEGLVPLSGLTDDFYDFDEPRLRYVGRDTGTVYRLGSHVRVKIVSVSVDDRRAQLEMVAGE